MLEVAWSGATLNSSGNSSLYAGVSASESASASAEAAGAGVCAGVGGHGSPEGPPYIVLLYGPSGVGKTSMVRLVTATSGASLVDIDTMRGMDGTAGAAAEALESLAMARNPPGGQRRAILLDGIERFTEDNHGWDGLVNRLLRFASPGGRLCAMHVPVILVCDDPYNGTVLRRGLATLRRITARVRMAALGNDAVAAVLRRAERRMAWTPLPAQRLSAEFAVPAAGNARAALHALAWHHQRRAVNKKPSRPIVKASASASASSAAAAGALRPLNALQARAVPPFVDAAEQGPWRAAARLVGGAALDPETLEGGYGAGGPARALLAALQTHNVSHTTMEAMAAACARTSDAAMILDAACGPGGAGARLGLSAANALETVARALPSKLDVVGFLWPRARQAHDAVTDADTSLSRADETRAAMQLAAFSRNDDALHAAACADVPELGDGNSEAHVTAWLAPGTHLWDARPRTDECSYRGAITAARTAARGEAWDAPYIGLLQRWHTAAPLPLRAAVVRRVQNWLVPFGQRRRQPGDPDADRGSAAHTAQVSAVATFGLPNDRTFVDYDD